MVLLAAGLVAAPCAVALTSPVEIQQAAQDVAGGTGTATESEEVNAVIDYLQAEFGVDPAKVSYQTITDGSGTTRTWSSDPAVQDLQGATDNALSGGSIEAAAGGELASAAEDTGVVSLLEEGGGVVCASSVGCAIAAGGVAAAIFVGPKLVEFFTGSGEQQNNNASSGICPYHVNQAQICGLQVPTKEIKVWCPVSPVSAGWDAATLSCTTTGVNNGPATRPSLWGGARNMNVDSSMPPCASAYPCVPTADVVNGGAWFLMEQWPDGSWSYGTSGFPAPGSDTSQCNGTTWNNYEFAWTAPPPGGPGSSSRWIQEADNDDNSGCWTGNGYADPAPVWKAGYSFEPGTKAHIGIPRANATCPSGLTCNTITPNPASSWCATATCLANLLASGSYPDLKQLWNAALGVTNPSTGQPYTEPGTIAVPNCAGLTPSACEAALTQAGFIMAPTETTLPETEPYVGDGDVVETVPEAGTTVDANTTVDLATNPSPPKVSTRDDQDCDVNNSTATYGDPGDPPYDGSQYPPYQEKKDAGSPYAAVVDPTGTNPAQTSLPLRYGTVAWGWRHILQSHPFTTLDQEQTATALETDSDPTLIYKSTSQWACHLFYTMVNGQPVNLPGVTLATAGSANPQSVGGSVLCVRTVRVEYYQDPTASELGVLGIRGINDSYVGRYTTG